MAKIPRKTQKIFGGLIAPTGNIVAFGSLAAGSPSFSSDVSALQTSAWDYGWSNAVVGTQQPALEDDNAINYVFSKQLAYLFQAGIPEWDASTVYYQGDACRVGMDIFFSKTDGNTGNNVANETHWNAIWAVIKPSIIDDSTVPRAWVHFDQNGVIKSAFNVTSVASDGNGVYTINFTTAMPNSKYAVIMSNAIDNSGAADMLTRFSYDAKTTGYVIVRGVTGQSSAQWPSNPENYVMIMANAAS